MTDPRYKLIQGDVRAVLSDLPTESVHCCVTSPPYLGLRDYSAPGQIGLEKSPAEYLDVMVSVFRDVRRVLRPDSTCWVNIGDSYGAGTAAKREQSRTHTEGRRTHLARTMPRNGLAAKQLQLIPQRLAVALQDDGWYIRQIIVWSKGSPMPESVTDRCTTSHEYILLLAKSPRYYFDALAIAEPSVYQPGSREDVPQGGFNGKHGDAAFRAIRPTRNARSVWHINSEQFPGSHFAVFPAEIPRRCISAGTSERGCCSVCLAPWRRVVEKSGGTTGKGWHDHKNDLTIGQQAKYSGGLGGEGARNGYKVETTGWEPTCKHDAPVVPATVLDPFSGAATTLLVALRLGRHGLGIELNEEYIAMSHRRIRDDEGANQMHMELAV